MTANREYRVPARLPVVEAESGTRPYYTKNLSLGGLFLMSDRRWAVGSHLKLTFKFGDEAIQAEARVTHIQADGVGFSFVAPSILLQETLRRIIEEQVTREAPPGSHRVRVAARAAWAIGDKRHDAALRDLSTGGAFIESATLPEPNGEIMLYLPAFPVLDGRQEVAELRGCAAKVVRLTDGGAALRFITPSAEFRMAVNDLLSKAAAKR